MVQVRSLQGGSCFFRYWGDRRMHSCPIYYKASRVYGYITITETTSLIYPFNSFPGRICKLHC
jgi:hypothetical protein